MNNRLIGKFIFVLLLLWPASFTVDNRSYFAGGVLTPPLFKYRKGDARPLWNPHLNGCTLQAAWSTKSAAEPTPVGLWKTIDDNTGQPKGLVRISERNGGIEGRVEKFFPKPGDDPAPKCDKCDGARHNQPVLGMTLVWNLSKQGNEYQGGEILDPENGKIYQAKMKLIDGGTKLEVRGFIGFSLFGRSQIWLREE